MISEYQSSPIKGYVDLLEEIKQNQAKLFWPTNKQNQQFSNSKEFFLAAIKNHLTTKSPKIDGCLSANELAEKIYNDLFEDSILTGPLNDIWVEAIYIKSWDSISVSFINGQFVKISGFNSPQHGEKVIRKLLRKEKLDNSESMVSGRTNSGNKITAFFPPCIREDCGVICTIQKKRKRSFSAQDYISNGYAAQKELEFLSLAVRYGTSILIVGMPNAGKSTLMEYLLSDNQSKNIIVLEQGQREIDTKQSLIIPNDKSPLYCINNLLDLSPDVIGFNLNTCVAQGAALQGCPVITTVCSSDPVIGLKLAAEQWRFQKANIQDAQTALELTGESFPLIVTIHQYMDRKKRIARISECSIVDRQIQMKTLWEYQVSSSQDGKSKTMIHGKHCQVADCSDTLLTSMALDGMSPEEIQIIKKEEN